jgi:hypothetical protein
MIYKTHTLSISNQQTLCQTKNIAYAKELFTFRQTDLCTQSDRLTDKEVMDRLSDSQTERKTDRSRDRGADRQRDRLTNRQTNRQTERNINRQTDR